GKLIDVIKVSVLSTKNTVVRELALIKLHVPDAKARSDVINYANIFRGRIVDVTSGSMVVEVTGTPDKIDAFLTLATTFGIKEIARTGVTALIRG
ncbi:MAG: acetolactate synthase small subunit, partial [archaeon]|nr:acetolactate synthase small subunit [archaeon]